MLAHDPAGQAERQGNENEAGQSLENHGNAPDLRAKGDLTSLHDGDVADYSQATELPRRRHMGR